MDKLIKYLLEKKEIDHLDYHFAKFATGLTGKEETEILLAAALVSRKTREGHICINLEEYEGRNLIANDELTVCPLLSNWLEKLKASPIVGKPEKDFKPLILDEKNRLYLYRYWAYENRIAKQIKKYIEENITEGGLEELPSRLNELFPSKKNGTADLQKLAAYTAVVKKFCVISGGPGTGKTTTVAKILALLASFALYPTGSGENEEDLFSSAANKKNQEGLRIQLAAPTGKAAARLQESIKNFKSKVNSTGIKISKEVLDLIPEEASTIHRLLGSRPGSPYFMHNRKNPLRADVLVVDEASMIDVALMSKLLEALREDAKLIILGDKDQLSSVEAGKFLGDVCTSALESSYSPDFYNVIKDVTGFPPEEGTSIENRHSLRDCFIHLKESHRFNDQSGIGVLSSQINKGNKEAAIQLLKESNFQDVSLKNVTSEIQLEKELKEKVSTYYKKYLCEDDPATAFKLFDQFRVLCAMREGPFGVNSINETIESIIKSEAITDVKKDWYKGMPIMITQNSYSLNLFNGDIGIVLPDSSAGGKLKAYFPSPDGSYRKLHQLRLPEYEKVYAMTVHKSQGSEFDNIVLILPDKQNPVLTRELLYTGVTRAKSTCEVWSSEKILMAAIDANIKRSSGLYDALRN